MPCRPRVRFHGADPPYGGSSVTSPAGGMCDSATPQLAGLRAELGAGPDGHGWDEGQRWTLARIVLHDVFAVPFGNIAVLLERTPAAAKMLASRARRRVQGAPVPDTDLARQRKVVDAFFAAARNGDFDALVALLAPDVVMRSDGGSAWPGFSKLIRGPRDVTGQALAGARLSQFMQPALVNQAAGAVIVRNGRPFSVIAFTVTGGKITEIDVIADPDRLHHIAPELINGSPATTASPGP
jgi:hypothetical protein